MGYFITDIDSDWGRLYDKFSVIKASKEYDLWVNKIPARSNIRFSTRTVITTEQQRRVGSDINCDLHCLAH